MRFCTEVVATNGYPGARVGDVDSVDGKPYIWIDFEGRHHAIGYFDGAISRLIRIGKAPRGAAIDTASDYAESLRVPLLLMENRPSAPAHSPRRA